MLAALRRPLVSRALLPGLVVLAAPLVAAPVFAGSGRAAHSVPPYQVVPGIVLHPRPPVDVLPVVGYRLTGRFGDRSSLWSTVHTGLDFAAPSGTTIRSVAAGVVVSTGYDGSYGEKTVVRLADGTELWYCHQSAVDVEVGQHVSPGDPIGAIGSTGNVTGPHLHLEVRPHGGDPVDPLGWLRGHGLQP